MVLSRNRRSIRWAAVVVATCLFLGNLAPAYAQGRGGGSRGGGSRGGGGSGSVQGRYRGFVCRAPAANPLVLAANRASVLPAAVFRPPANSTRAGVAIRVAVRPMAVQSSRSSTQTSGQSRTQGTDRQGDRSDRSGNRQENAGSREGDRTDTRDNRSETSGDNRGDRQEEGTDRQDNRQDGRTDRTDSRQDGATDRVEERADFYDDYWGSYHHGYHHHDYWHGNDAWWALAAGLVIGASIASLPPTL